MSGFDVQVMGAGSLGSLLGGILANNGARVNLVARRPHVDAVRDNGLYIRGEMDIHVYPDASTTPGNSEITLVTVKSYDTSGAARAIKGRQRTAVSLQNGMGNLDEMESVLTCELMNGVCTYGANLVEPGVVECTGMGDIKLGSKKKELEERCREINGFLERNGLNASVSSDIERDLWRKLGVNACINPVTALTGLSNGETANTCESVMRKIAQEVELVAEENNVFLDGLGDEVLEVAKRTQLNHSSMLQDIEKQRRTEIDAINGFVSQKTSDDAPAPLNNALFQLVKGLERSYIEEDKG